LADDLPVHLYRWGMLADEVSEGQRFTVVERAPPWARIEWGGAQAWVEESGVEPVPGAEVAVVADKIERVYTHERGGLTLGYAAPGQAFPVLKLSLKKVQIQFDERSGWLKRDAVTVQKTP
jgi:hypothetical protein